MKSRTSNNTLSREEIAWLIFGESLLSGIKNPFGGEVAAERAYLQYEQELIRIFAERYPGRRPLRFWEHHPREAVGSAAWIKPDGRVRISPVLESDAQYLWRTKTYLPHEQIGVENKAIADGIEQQRRIENTRAWVLQGEGSKLPRILRTDDDTANVLSRRPSASNH